MYQFDFSVLLQDYKAILNGIYLTIIISILASILAFALGTFFVYLRTSPNQIIKTFATLTVSALRNTPLLIVIYFFYKGLPSIGIVFEAFSCGVLALGIYSASYISDAILSGINATPKEHEQAGQALGLKRLQVFIYVIYPQALRSSTFVLGSQFMNLVKNSSLVSFITVADIFYVTYKGISDTYRVYEYFIMAIIVYCSLTGIVLLITNTAQKKFSYIKQGGYLEF